MRKSVTENPQILIIGSEQTLLAYAQNGYESLKIIKNAFKKNSIFKE